jgi:LysR family glycine cleavage system transcriptional activator
MLPDLESLRCFEAAATHPSFRVAARAVALSPAAFGERIKRLEDTLGVALFHRTSRRVAMTAAGAQLVPQARRVLEEARRCLQVAAGDGAPLPYEVTVGTRFELGLSWLATSLGRLEAAHPERTVHLFFSDGPVLVSRVLEGRIDAAVTSARLAVPNLEIAPLHREDYVLVAAAKLVARKPLARPRDAAGHTLIDSAPDLPLFRYFQEAAPPGQWWRFARLSYLGTIGAIRLRVREGAGVAVLPRYFVEKDLAKGTLVPLVPRVKPLSDLFRLIWRADHPRALELRQLAADLQKLPLQ